MQQVRFYSLLSVLAVSAVSLIGVVTLGLSIEKLKKIILFLVSFSAGALLGDVFIHLLPQIIAQGQRTVSIGIYCLSGIVFGFVTEKFIHRNHCHMPITKTHIHPFALMNLVGDAVHNFIDGLIIAGSYLVSIPVGIATTLAVLLHEVPQEMGDFGVLIHGGFSKKRAIFVNFLTALTAVLGVVIALLLQKYVSNISSFLVPFAAGSFIYIAGSDLIPELHKQNKSRQIAGQLLGIVLGIGVMMLLLIGE